MNFISDTDDHLACTAINYNEIFAEDDAQDVRSCIRLLNWAAKSNDPEGRLLYTALIERIKQQPSDTGQAHINFRPRKSHVP